MRRQPIDADHEIIVSLLRWKIHAARDLTIVNCCFILRKLPHQKTNVPAVAIENLIRISDFFARCIPELVLERRGITWGRLLASKFD